jgi:hypothetical protein
VSLSSRESARQAAEDPTTPATTLHHLAKTWPDLWLTIAAHEQASPDLLDWLAARGDGNVNDVIARRRAAEIPTSSASPAAETETPAPSDNQTAETDTPAPSADQTAEAASELAPLATPPTSASAATPTLPASPITPISPSAPTSPPTPTSAGDSETESPETAYEPIPLFQSTDAEDLSAVPPELPSWHVSANSGPPATAATAWDPNRTEIDLAGSFLGLKEPLESQSRSEESDIYPQGSPETQHQNDAASWSLLDAAGPPPGPTDVPAVLADLDITALTETDAAPPSRRPRISRPVLGRLLAGVAIIVVLAVIGFAVRQLWFGPLPDVAPLFACSDETGQPADVIETSPFRQPVCWLAEKGIIRADDITAYDADGVVSYRPGEPASRAAAAVVLFRAAGRPRVDVSAAAAFQDVDSTGPTAAAIAWLASKGLASGSVFRPDEPVTRAEIAVWLYLWADGESLPPADSPYADVSPDDPAWPAIAWLASQGGGADFASAGVYRPDFPLSRGALAAFVYEVMN